METRERPCSGRAVGSWGPASVTLIHQYALDSGGKWRTFGERGSNPVFVGNEAHCPRLHFKLVLKPLGALGPDGLSIIVTLSPGAPRVNFIKATCPRGQAAPDVLSAPA